MKRNEQNIVFAVLSSGVFHTYIEAAFDSELLAIAYMQKRIDAVRAKHKRGYGGRWITEPDGSRTVMLRMCNQPHIQLKLQKLNVQTKL